VSITREVIIMNILDKIRKARYVVASNNKESNTVFLSKEHGFDLLRYDLNNLLRVTRSQELIDVICSEDINLLSDYVKGHKIYGMQVLIVASELSMPFCTYIFPEVQS
jgi:hypothetical protein